MDRTASPDKASRHGATEDMVISEYLYQAMEVVRLVPSLEGTGMADWLEVERDDDWSTCETRSACSDVDKRSL